MESGASNFVRADYLEMRLARIEERLDRLEKMVEGITNLPFRPRTIQ